MKKVTPFVWSSRTEEAFVLLNKAMVEALELAILNFTKPFVLETNTCDYGLGTVLMQEGHLVAYLSKPLCTKNQAMSTYEKKCMAILMAIDKWRPYLQAQEFTIKTDHKCLLYLTEQRVHTKLSIRFF